MAQLTKAAKNSIAIIYSEYLKRMKNGLGKEKATTFLQEDSCIRGMAKENISELCSAGFLKKDILGDIYLSNQRIIFMEELPANTLKEWFAFTVEIFG